MARRNIVAHGTFDFQGPWILPWNFRRSNLSKEMFHTLKSPLGKSNMCRLQPCLVPLFSDEFLGFHSSHKTNLIGSAQYTLLTLPNTAQSIDIAPIINQFGCSAVECSRTSPLSPRVVSDPDVHPWIFGHDLVEGHPNDIIYL